MSTIKNLIKAHKSLAISQDTFSLKDFVARNSELKGERQGIAQMELAGIETKYIPKYDTNSPQWNGEASGNGHRTRFILSNGDTIGSFSQASHELFKFFAMLMGHRIEGLDFLHIDIKGKILVDVRVLQLDSTKSTYDFSIIEEGSDLQGFSEYLPNAQEILGLSAPTQFVTEALPEPTQEAEPNQEAEGDLPDEQPTKTKTVKGAK